MASLMRLRMLTAPPHPVRWSALFTAVTSLAVVLVFAVPLTGPRPLLAAGDIAPRTYKAPRDIPPFLSQFLTDERKRAAATAVPEALAFDATVGDEQTSLLRDLLQHIEVIRDSERLSPDQRVAAMRQIDDLVLSPPAVEALLAMNNPAWEHTAAEADAVLRQIGQLRFPAVQALAVQGAVGAMLPPTLDAGQRLVAQELVRPLIRPTLVPDADQTEQAREAAAEQVAPAYVSISKGEVIARDGQVLSEAHIERLRAAGLLNSGIPWRELAGIGLVVTVLSVLIAAFLARRGATVPFTPRRLLLVGMMLVGTATAAKLLLPAHPAWVYLFPFAAGPLLMAILLDASTALVLAMAAALLAAFAADYAPELGGFAPATALETLERITFFFAGAVAGVLRAATARRLSQLFAAGVAISVASTLTVVAFGLVIPERESPSLAVAVAAAIANGALSAALAAGAFVVAGHLFGITTSVQLLELAQPDHPLLRRLLTEAPGTYYHSLLVSNLAERAAEAVGADPLLARVGAYYHDVGKVLNPGFFIENQRAGTNPHDRLMPQESAAVIIAHVEGGLRLAKEYRLPARVQDFIVMHHGTRLTVYFYHKAVAEAAATGGVPEASAFSYPGPRPQGKEPALVMLADSLEAATRSLQRPTPDNIDTLVDRIVAERVSEGQLDESDLTLRDLERAKAAFKLALRGIFHPRIAYPQGVPGTAAQAGRDIVRLFDPRRRTGSQD